MEGSEMKNEFLKNKLLANIDMKRQLLIKITKDIGYTSEKTVKYSQELDMFIFEYQQICWKKTS